MPINVIIADDQLPHLDRLKDQWSKALGPGPRFDIAHDIKTVEEKLIYRPHLVIVDNQFSLSTNEGATFIAKHKDKYPDTVFVLMTGQGFDIEQLGQRTPNPDFIVPKSYLLVNSYLEYIGRAVKEKIRRVPANVSSPPDGLTEINVTREAFCSLVEQCLSSLEVLDFDVHAEPTASFTLLSGGYSGASVYQMAVSGSGKSPALPLVLKCGNKAQVQREIAAFERWVRWQLPHDMRVDVIGRGYTGDHAAVCYGFVLGTSKRLKSLSQAIKDAEQELVSDSLERLFFAERTGWYKPSREGKNSLCGYMLNTQEYDPRKDDRRNLRLRSVLKQLSKNENFSVAEAAGELVVFGKQHVSVRRAVGAIDQSKAKLTYCHGDLNANNVFLDEDHDGMALIDFEQSGESHIMRDFVSIETSFRMDLPPDWTNSLGFEELVHLERMLLGGEDGAGADQYGTWIRQIRDLAHRRYPDADRDEYLVPLLLHSWKVLGIKPWEHEVERRLAAMVLAGLENIAERG